MLLKTNDGRETTMEAMRALFEEVCKQMESNDPEFNWKETISFEEPYTTAERSNDLMSAIDFMVAGKTEIHPYFVDGVLHFQYLNKGYYANGC